LDKVDAFSKLKPGETIFGELIGPGVQKNYEYGHKEHHFVLFDVKVEKEDGSQEYLDPEQAEAYAKERGFDFVPVLYRGVFNAALAKELSMGPSVYCPSEKVREGVVIKARTEYSNASSKKALKLISEEYLDDPSNTDNH
jgi:RNA ligase (TIGR02306 family)